MSEAEKAVRAAARVVARSSGVSVSAVLAPRGRRAKRLRQEAIYLAVTAAGVNCSAVARAAGLYRYAVQNALARIEDRRDDPRTDARIERLERRMGAVA